MKLDVDALPRRVAHVTHALMESSTQYAFGMGLRTPSEVMIYDEEALSLSATSHALVRAMRRGLVDRGGHGLWFPTNLALDHRRAFEDRYLRDTGEASVA